MLQIKNLKKEYVTNDLHQTALNDVSLNFRRSEFVAVLGPSGSGKTTLLNIIGGLDRYDSGDIIINNISTKKYKDKDWDSYRNHSVGFVFQNYNLITHQTILSNVELALTLSGIKKKERKRLAREALNKVGLGEHSHKKPNQLSGGQMQRVAIARALVNNPDIILADEPTGALDTETSIQIMELLKEVAKDRLVIMVTHNPELANEYANRIIKIKDGKITEDTNPFNGENKEEIIEHKNLGKSSMNFLTSLSLSFNNLKTKKGRTFLTAFAGSIGIIGIALILSFSNGVNQYINDIQKEVMTSYPISITKQAIDLTTMIPNASNDNNETSDTEQKKDAVYSDNSTLQMASNLLSSFSTNNLTDFKKHLDDKDNPIRKHIGENGILYSYDTDFDVYSYDSDGTLVTADNVNVNISDDTFVGKMTNSLSAIESFTNTSSNIFSEILPDNDGLVSQVIKDNYEVVNGKWPENYNEVVLVVDANNQVPIIPLYDLGLLPSADYNVAMDKLNASEQISKSTVKVEFDKVFNQSLHLLTETDKYTKTETGYDYAGKNVEKLKKVLNNGTELKIVGVIKPIKDADITIEGSVGYTRKLTEYIIDHINTSEVVVEQKENPDTNILNGFSFAPKTDEEKIADVHTYLNTMSRAKKAEYGKTIIKEMNQDNSEQATAQIAMMSENDLVQLMEQTMANMDNENLLKIYDTYVSSGSYDENMEKFHVVDIASPSEINIYVDTFEAKDEISKYIEEYNRNAEEKNKITYTDYIGLLLSSVTTIINVISIVLIAFVSVSLIVSSIMIGIITYISVLERTKEIGILRAIGASKKNISQVFNAETLIIGLFSGMLGVGIVLLILIPGNMIIHAITGIPTINAVLTVQNSVLLILLSIILTLIGGLLPARKAAKKDPVMALHSE